MKKFITSIVILTLIAGNAGAQDQSSEEVQFGIKAGANISNVYDKEGGEYTTKPRMGLALGAFFTIPLGSVLGIQPEIMYSQKGYQASGTISGSDYKFRHTSHFIDVPFFLMLKTGPVLTLLAGPQFSFLLKESDEFTNTTFSDPDIDEDDFANSSVRKNTLGLVIGGDLNFGSIVLGFRAGYDMVHNNGDGTQTAARYKNVYYQGTFGFRL